MTEKNINKFEEYKLFIEDTARFSDRRQTVNNIYVAVNSIMLCAMAFFAKDARLDHYWQAFVIILVMIAGIVICLQWDRLIFTYKKLIKLRFEELRVMEKSPEMADSHKMYHQEDKLYPQDSHDKPILGKGLNISDRERWLPRTFICLYAVFIIIYIILLVKR